MLPEVKNCAVQECYYNKDEICHAQAILIGSDHPLCDTFIVFRGRHSQPTQQGRVGACHQDDCRWNETLSCTAPSINVDYHENHADCYTYDPVENLERDEDVQLARRTPEVISEGSTAIRLTARPSENIGED